MTVTIRNANGIQGTKDICQNVAYVHLEPASKGSAAIRVVVVYKTGYVSLFYVKSARQISVKIIEK